MISCIICSRYPQISDEYKKNIDLTIGCNYELIVVDNSNNYFNIFSAYNEGLKRSSGDIVCFMHDDICFHTNNWGMVVECNFKNNDVGLLGVVGTHFVPKCAAPWWSSYMKSGQLIQGNVLDGNYVCKEEIFWSRRGCGHDSIDAVIVDGLWFCVRRSLFDNGYVRFDNQTFNGFHCYDADICMQVLSIGYNVRITYEILIEHKSLGDLNIVYFEQLNLWFDKWKDKLPIFRGVVMADVDIEERENFSSEYTFFIRNNELLNYRLERVYSSMAYKIGNFILKPIRFFRRLVEKMFICYNRRINDISNCA